MCFIFLLPAAFRVVQTVFLDTPDQPPRVVIELNRNCRDDVYNIVVNFGTQQSAEDGCVIVPAARREEKWNPVLDQEPHPFMLDTNAVTLQEGAVYCYTATLNGTGTVVFTCTCTCKIVILYTFIIIFDKPCLCLYHHLHCSSHLICIIMSYQCCEVCYKYKHKCISLLSVLLLTNFHKYA